VTREDKKLPLPPATTEDDDDDDEDEDDADADDEGDADAADVANEGAAVNDGADADEGADEEDEDEDEDDSFRTGCGCTVAMKKSGLFWIQELQADARQYGPPQKVTRGGNFAFFFGFIEVSSSRLSLELCVRGSGQFLVLRDSNRLSRMASLLELILAVSCWTSDFLKVCRFVNAAIKLCSTERFICFPSEVGTRTWLPFSSETQKGHCPVVHTDGAPIAESWRFFDKKLCAGEPTSRFA
jgi:hypothetical protein